MIDLPRRRFRRRLTNTQGGPVKLFAPFCLLVLLLSMAFSQGPKLRQPTTNQAGRATAALAHAPLMFVEQVGQLAQAAHYVLYGGATSLALAEDGIWLTMQNRQSASSRAD